MKVKVRKWTWDSYRLHLVTGKFCGSLKRMGIRWRMSFGLNQDYQSNDNDQAVVEICITRITTAIRETASIDKHGKALVALWESCLEHNLKPAGKDEDTPHAKIASDITSCILQVRSSFRGSVMCSLALQPWLWKCGGVGCFLRARGRGCSHLAPRTRRRAMVYVIRGMWAPLQ